MFANCKNSCNENGLIEWRRFLILMYYIIRTKYCVSDEEKNRKRNIKYINKHHHSNEIQKRLVKRFKEILFLFFSCYLFQYASEFIFFSTNQLINLLGKCLCATILRNRYYGGFIQHLYLFSGYASHY